MNTIYMLAPGPYFENVLEGFAYDYDGLCRIAERHVRECLVPEDAPLVVTIKDGEVTVTEEDGWDHIYTIHTIEKS